MLCDQELVDAESIILQDSAVDITRKSFKETKARMVNEFERDYLLMLLMAHDGNITRAANEAQKDRRAFVQLIRKHNIHAEEFKPRSPKRDR